MTIQLKSTMIVLATLFLGVLIGILGSRWLHEPPKFKPHEMRDPGGFIQFNEHLIQPTVAQRDTIRKILIKYYNRFTDLDREHRVELKAVLDSMRRELDPLLTKEQRKRMEHPRPNLSPNESNRHDPFPPGPPMGHPDSDDSRPNEFPGPPDPPDRPRE
jgi:hypothetical protein